MATAESNVLSQIKLQAPLLVAECNVICNKICDVINFFSS